MLLIGSRRGDRHAIELKALGFPVTAAGDGVEDAVLLRYPVVVVGCNSVTALPTVAAWLRAKPNFARRVIIARVPDDTDAGVIRSLRVCGFDEVVLESVATRVMAARIIRRIRARPELGCDLPHIPKTPAA